MIQAICCNQPKMNFENCQQCGVKDCGKSANKS